VERKKASDFDPRLLELFDGYVHGKVTKRAFFDQAATFAVGGVTVAALVDSLMPDYALAQQVAPNDPAIAGERITYDSPDGHGTINGYLVKPAGAAGPVPVVVVVHENRGLNPYIEYVARRVAKAGFTALAPDGLTPLGGYPGNDDQGREMQRELDPIKLAEDFFAAFETLMARDDVGAKVGVVGFCYGGGIANAMAVRYPELLCLQCQEKVELDTDLLSAGHDYHSVHGRRWAA
jgi:carboxymethylenebutenolidase